MVSNASSILDSGYTIGLVKAYSGNNAYHWYWSVYPDDTSWYWSDTHGNLPRTSTCYFSFRKESSSSPIAPSIHECSFVSKFNGLRYTVSITNRWVKSFAKCALMSILNVYANNSSIPNISETITIDIDNKGGNGNFDLALFDGGVEIDRVSGKSISGNCSIRETMSFVMLSNDMTLTIQIIDLYDDEVVDTMTFDVTVYDPCDGIVCEPACFGYDLHNTICYDGACIKESLIDPNSVKCVYDICEGVVCNPECFGVDYYNMVCEEGKCVQETIINANYPGCGYVSTTTDNNEIIDAIIDNKEIIMLAALAGIIVI